MVAAGLVLGLVTGGFPATYSGTILDFTLILAMVFALTEISFRGISPRSETRGVALSFAMNYGALGGLVLLFGLWSANSDIRSGWILMAAVPPAIGVVPITSFLTGDVRRALISNAVIYLLGLATVPLLSLLFLGQAVPATDLVVQTLLLIGIPIVVSRPLRRWEQIQKVRPTAVGVSFFFSVLTIAGSTRSVLLGRPDLVVDLSGLAFLRTFGLGLALYVTTRAVAVPRKDRIAVITFAGFKNLGLTVVLAFTFFGPLAALPSIVSLVFEILWTNALPFLFRVPARGVRRI